ncbi:MAG TPA: DUF5335 family protein [Tepidisphaeraceae bacterium]|jgi:hypothetical protein|nr:DUF5335 family protein [Tepidisphaeraceae bacterium]
MNSQTIPPEHWISFLDEFSRDHLGWLATIEVLDAVAGPQNVADDLPLEGISLDVKGTRPSSIDISVGDWSHHHVNHVVDMPMHIRQADDVGRVDLQFEPGVGPVTLLHLRSRAIGRQEGENVRVVNEARLSN